LRAKGVDRRRTQSLGYITVGLRRPNFATDFQVDASIGGGNWTTVGSAHSSGWGSVPVEFTRYLRIVTDKPDDGGQRTRRLRRQV